MNTNLDSAITAAITAVADILNEPVEAIAAKAFNDGPIRDSVMLLAVHAGAK